MFENNFKDINFLGHKRKPMPLLFTLEDIQAMEVKTNDEYENSEQEMKVEDNYFNVNAKNQSLFIPIGNGQFILDYEKIEKNTNLILPKAFYENKNLNQFNNWTYSECKNYLKEYCSNYYEK